MNVVLKRKRLRKTIFIATCSKYTLVFLIFLFFFNIIFKCNLYTYILIFFTIHYLCIILKILNILLNHFPWSKINKNFNFYIRFCCILVIIIIIYFSVSLKIWLARKFQSSFFPYFTICMQCETLKLHSSHLLFVSEEKFRRMYFDHLGLKSLCGTT